MTGERTVKDPNWDKELIHSWYRLGAFSPFFRAHAHIDSFYREPWCFPQDLKSRIRDTIHLRYRLLVYLYTHFFLSQNFEHGSCMPVMRPLWMQEPMGRHEKRNESSYFFGSSILVSQVHNGQRDKIGNIQVSHIHFTSSF